MRAKERGIRKIKQAMILWDEPGDSGVTDMLTDMMHYCRYNAISFDDVLNSAKDHFEAESSKQWTFCELQVGATFDFINDAMPTYNSFFDRCRKISTRKYISIEPCLKEATYLIGSINARVFHVRDNHNDEEL